MFICMYVWIFQSKSIQKGVINISKGNRRKLSTVHEDKSMHGVRYKAIKIYL